MSVRFFQIDAFTSEPFRGNPAAVCLLESERDESWMQDVAMEMNLSETAFVVPKGDRFALRWFTPSVEVPLCGHATLAAAHAIWEAGLLPRTTSAHFETKSGSLFAHSRDGAIELDFPVKREESSEAPSGFSEALGAKPIYVGKNALDYLALFDDERTVRTLVPDHAALRKLPLRAIIVTAKSSAAGVDFVSRFFAPGVGIDEDPVTGSAHCCLTPFWSERLEKKEMTGYQASARGGTIRVRLDGDRVRMAGSAVTILRGELLV